MKTRAVRRFAVAAASAVLLLPVRPAARADEGMWLFNAPPTQRLKEKYNFEPSAAWLDHVQKSSVRFNSGGSGSFVSADGLCITNHHVGADALQKFGDEQHNYLRDGFYAKTPGRGKTLPRPGIECPRVHRGRDHARQRGHQTGHGFLRGPRRRGAPSSPASKRSPRTRPACAPTWSRSTRAAHTISTVTSVTRTCGWSSRPSSRRPSTAATRITSSTRATTSTSASSAPTKTASPPTPSSYLKWSPNGTDRARTRLRQRPSRLDRAAS